MPRADTTEYKRTYVLNHYDRIYITVPKGDKEKIEKLARDHRYRSVNQMLNVLISQEYDRNIACIFVPVSKYDIDRIPGNVEGFIHDAIKEKLKKEGG